MNPKTWMNEKGMAYLGLLTVSLMGVAYLLSITAMKLAGTPFEPIDPTIVAVLSTILAVMAMENSKSSSSANGE